jgi:hypothetical protein
MANAWYACVDLMSTTQNGTYTESERVALASMLTKLIRGGQLRLQRSWPLQCQAKGGHHLKKTVRFPGEGHIAARVFSSGSEHASRSL